MKKEKVIRASYTLETTGTEHYLIAITCERGSVPKLYLRRANWLKANFAQVAKFTKPPSDQICIRYPNNQCTCPL